MNIQTTPGQLMDSFVWKLRSTVSTTVSNINNILPGNPVTRDYEINSQIASAGPGLVWRVYSATKKSTKEEASVFVFEKKIVEKYSRKQREAIIDLLRRGVHQLTKLRHPSILTVQHPLEESRDSLAFAAEPIFGTLVNILGNCENFDQSSPSENQSFEFYDLEIKYGLLQVSEAIAFLHNDAKILHRNLSPEVIAISKSGAWKLTGFDFCAQPLDPNRFPLQFPALNLSQLAGSNDPVTIMCPNLDYISPESIVPSENEYLSFAADMFSVGALICAIYNKGNPLLPTGQNISTITSSRIEQLKKLPNQVFQQIPEQFSCHVKSLLNTNHELRPDIHKFRKQEFFDDVLVRTLQYLDSLFQFDNLEKSKFYRGLPEIMQHMPKRVKVDRVYTALAKEFVNPDMIPFLLPVVFLIIEEVTDDEFVEKIFPSMVNFFTIKEPIQIPMMLMRKMEILLGKCKNHQDSIKTHLLPMFCLCLENDSSEVCELCLETLPAIAHLIDQPSMKNSIIPRIKKLCLGSRVLSARVNCLICLAKLLPFFDRWLVIDEIISFLVQIQSGEAAVVMAVVGLIRLIINNDKLGLTKEVIANKLVPYLMPLTIENGLSTSQFVTLLILIRDLITLVEKEQKVKLQQLDDIKAQQNSALVAYVSKDNGIMTTSSTSNSSFSLFETSNPNKMASLPSTPVVPLPIEAPKVSMKSSPSMEIKSNPSPVRDLTSMLMDSNLSNLTADLGNKMGVNSMNQSSFVQPMMVSPKPSYTPMPTTRSSFAPTTQPQRPVVDINKGFANLASLSDKKSRGVPMNSMINNNSMGGFPSSSLVPMSANSVMSSMNSQKSTINKLSESDLKEFLS